MFNFKNRETTLQNNRTKAIQQMVAVTVLAFGVGIVYGYEHFGLAGMWLVSLGTTFAGGLAAWFLPHKRSGLVMALAATFLLRVPGFFTQPWGSWLTYLSDNDTVRYWLVSGPGNGALGLLPLTLFVLLVGRWLFGFSLSEQWGGTFSFNRRIWGYGLLVGVGFALLVIGLSLATGEGELQPLFDWNAVGVNLFSNLWEEIIFRGMLLQVIRKHLGVRTAMVWTSVLFGLAHGINPKGFFIALTCWTWAWAVLKSRSLWAGWITHQVSDMLIDNLLSF